MLMYLFHKSLDSVTLEYQIQVLAQLNYLFQFPTPTSAVLIWDVTLTIFQVFFSLVQLLSSMFIDMLTARSQL